MTRNKPTPDSGKSLPGDKLLPRLSDVVIKSILATKLGLTDHEVKVRQVSGQNLIDQIGREAAEIGRPMIEAALDYHGENMPPIVREYLESAASGDDQIKSISGVLFGGVQGSIAQVVSNYLSPIAYHLNEIAPNLDIDVTSAAQAQAANIVTLGEMYEAGRQQGVPDGVMNTYRDLAQSIPPVNDLNEMYNRGFITFQQKQAWLERQALPVEFIQLYENIRTQLITVADASLAVLRTDITLDQGYEIAEQNGYTRADFDILISNTGEPPGAQELMEALRRGFIDEATFKTGIRQSRVRDQWIQTLLDLRYSPLNTADAVDAHVEGYVDEATVKSVADQNGLLPEQYKILIQAAGDPLSFTDMMNLWRWGLATEQDVRDALKRGRLKDDYIDFALKLKVRPISVADAVESEVQGYITQEQGIAIAEKNGISRDDYLILRNTAGDPASRTEMIQLWRRGLVTEDDVIAALRESRLKDSYIPDVLKLKVQLPALYETRALLADGGLTAEQGTAILLAQGYEDDIVKAIVANALGQTTAVHKQLTEAMYADLYKERAISSQDFLTELEALGYSQAGAELIQAIYDNQIAITQRNAVITKVKAAYTSNKFTEADAQSELNQLGLPAETVDILISDWDLIKATNIRLLTAAQVVDAWFMNLFNSGDPADNTQQALTYLSTLGYDAGDAILVLEIKNKGPLTNDSASKPVQGTVSSPPAGGAS